MTEIRKLHECSIPVGRKGSVKRLHRFTKRIGAVYSTADRFACRYCRTEWHRFDFAGTNMDTVTCSNCYGEDVMCIQVEAVFYAAGASA